MRTVLACVQSEDKSDRVKRNSHHVHVNSFVQMSNYMQSITCLHVIHHDYALVFLLLNFTLIYFGPLILALV